MCAGQACYQITHKGVTGLREFADHQALPRFWSAQHKDLQEGTEWKHTNSPVLLHNPCLLCNLTRSATHRADTNLRNVIQTYYARCVSIVLQDIHCLSSSPAPGTASQATISRAIAGFEDREAAAADLVC